MDTMYLAALCYSGLYVSERKTNNSTVMTFAKGNDTTSYHHSFQLLDLLLMSLYIFVQEDTAPISFPQKEVENACSFCRGLMLDKKEGTQYHWAQGSVQSNCPGIQKH